MIKLKGVKVTIEIDEIEQDDTPPPPRMPISHIQMQVDKQKFSDWAKGVMTRNAPPTEAEVYGLINLNIDNVRMVRIKDKFIFPTQD